MLALSITAPSVRSSTRDGAVEKRSAKDRIRQDISAKLRRKTDPRHARLKHTKPDDSVQEIISKLEAIKEIGDKEAAQHKRIQRKKTHRQKSKLLRKMEKLIRLMGKKTWSFDRIPLVQEDVAATPSEC